MCRFIVANELKATRFELHQFVLSSNSFGAKKKTKSREVILFQCRHFVCCFCLWSSIVFFRFTFLSHTKQRDRSPSNARHSVLSTKMRSSHSCRIQMFGVPPQHRFMKFFSLKTRLSLALRKKPHNISHVLSVSKLRWRRLKVGVRLFRVQSLGFFLLFFLSISLHDFL